MMAEESKKESEAAPEGAVEMKEEELDQASGGAVDAFIQFKDPGRTMAAPQGETQDTSGWTGPVTLPPDEQRKT